MTARNVPVLRGRLSILALCVARPPRRTEPCWVLSDCTATAADNREVGGLRPGCWFESSLTSRSFQQSTAANRNRESAQSCAVDRFHVRVTSGNSRNTLAILERTPSAPCEHPVSNRVVAPDCPSPKAPHGRTLKEIARPLGPGDLRQKNAALKSIEETRIVGACSRPLQVDCCC
jgi:hypothetical protein